MNHHDFIAGLRRKPIVAALFLCGLIGWLSPLVSAARRPKLPPISVNADAETGLCVSGYSQSGSQKYAVLNEHVVQEGQMVHWQGRRYLVSAIDADGLLLRHPETGEERVARWAARE